MPALVLGSLLTLYPVAVICVAPDVAAWHSDREAAALIADAGSASVIAFGIRDPSLTFYLGAPVFAGDGLAFLLTSPRHYAEVEWLLGPRAHVWLETPRRRLYANRATKGST